MSVEIEESGPVERRLRVEVPTAEVDAAFDKVYRKLQKRSNVRGFRPGKTPRAVLERYFGEQAQGDVLDVVVRETLGKAISDSELPIVAEPRLEPEGLPKQGAPFVYQATVEIRPEITLAQIRGLALTEPKLTEPDEDPVEAHLEQLRLSESTLVDAEEGATASQGHVAIVHYEGTIEGEPFPGGEGRDLEVEIGSGQALPGFEDALIGLRAGEEREVDVDVPESDSREAVRGKRIHFRIELAALKRRDLAALDDEFAKDVSDFDTIDALRADLRERLEQSRDAERKRQLREGVIDAAIAANPFPVPPTLVEHQLSHRLQQAVRRFGGRLSDDRLRPLVESWAEEWKPQAERDVRFAFLVEEIVKSEGLSVSDEDFDAQLREMAEASDRPVATLQREYREAGLDDALRRRILEDRVIELLLTEATVSEAGGA